MTDSLLADPAPSNNTDPNKNYLNDYINEGGKFHDPNKDLALEKLAKGKFEADNYIKHLESRLDDMRKDYLNLDSEYKSRARLEELADRLADKQLTSSDNTPNANEVNTPQLDPKLVESLVSNKLKEYEISKRQEDNFELVRSKLKERFGPNYQHVIKEQSENLGLTEDFVNNLARTQPNALFKLFNVDATSSPNNNFQAPPTSSQRSDSFAPKTPKRTWTYYQNLKKTDYKTYSDPRTQTQMYKDAMELGEEFEDGDFYTK